MKADLQRKAYVYLMINLPVHLLPLLQVTAEFV